jgi:signal transduction histidine kinase
MQARHVSFLTHELRDPLGTAMLTASQLRRRDAPIDEGALDRLDRCHERLSNMIERVLRTQTFETEKPTCRPAAKTLGQILGGAFDRAREAAANKGLDLRVSFDPCVALQVDPLLTRVVAQRLVEEAVADTEAGWIDVVVEERRDAIVFHLRDTCAAVGRADLAIAKRAVEVQGGSLATEPAGAAARHLRFTLPKRAIGGGAREPGCESAPEP